MEFPLTVVVLSLSNGYLGVRRSAVSYSFTKDGCKLQPVMGTLRNLDFGSVY